MALPNRIKGIDRIMVRQPDNSHILCEVTHPNYMGRSIYIASAEEKPRPGDELRTLTRGRGGAASQIIETSVRALSWACMTQVTAFALMRDAIGRLLVLLSGDTR